MVAEWARGSGKTGGVGLEPGAGSAEDGAFLAESARADPRTAGQSP